MESVFPGVFRQAGRFFVQSRIPGFRVHGERIVRVGNVEFREWSHSKSKISAALAKGLKNFPLKKDQSILYLGAAQGVTPSFFSDLVGPQGNVYCVEISPRAMRDLIFVCEKRDNMHPILADALQPESYLNDVGTVDIVYEDVAAKEQAEILLRNCVHLKKGGHALIAIKSQSINSAVAPEKTYRSVLDQLSCLTLLETIKLDPLEKDHLFCVFRKP